MRKEKPPTKGAEDRAAGVHNSTENPGKSQSRLSRANVGGGFSVAFNIRQDGHADCTWSPRMPTGREFRRKVSEEKYEAALRRFLLDQVGSSS